MISFLLLPFYHCIKDREKLERFNSKVCKVVYFPIALGITLVFEIISLLLTPLAWIKVVINKY